MWKTVPANTCVIKMLRSPARHALITRPDVSKAEALPGVVVHIITHKTVRMCIHPGGQSAPEQISA